MPRTSDFQIRCAENIAALFFLGDVPMGPERYDVYESYEEAATTGGRQLSMQTEKTFTETIGILSSIRDDPNRITAVCVEEMNDSLCVMVAANAKGAHNSPYLEQVKSGLDNIFCILGKALIVPREKLQQEVLMAIIDMCRERIQSRLRIGNKVEKPSLQSFLLESSESLRQLEAVDGSKAFQTGAAELTSLMNQYCDLAKNERSPDDLTTHDVKLAEVVESFYMLSRTPNLSRLLLDDLDKVKPKMDPCSRQSLLNNIEKISQYFSSAIAMVKIARACAPVRHAIPFIVRLDDKAFERAVVNHSDFPTLGQVVGRIATSWNADVDLATLCDRLQKPIITASKDFRSLLENTTAQSKVHAEVQLISHLDMRPTQHPPRVIASNKDACFLCNEFIRFHGRHVISKCHGRLHPGWRLPATTPEDLAQRFNTRLEELFVSRAKRIIQGNVEKLHYPLESTRVSAAASMNTMFSTRDKSVERVYESGSDDTLSTAKHVNFGNERGSSREYVAPNISSSLAQQQLTTRISNDGVARPLGTKDDDRRSSIEWKAVSQGKMKCGFASDALCVFIECAESTMEHKEPLTFRTWRDAEQDKEVNGEEVENIPVYDLSTNRSEVYELSCSEVGHCIKVKVGDEVVMVELGQTYK